MSSEILVLISWIFILLVLIGRSIYDLKKRDYKGALWMVVPIFIIIILILKVFVFTGYSL